VREVDEDVMQGTVKLKLSALADSLPVARTTATSVGRRREVWV
jgi:hypothetical protein